MNKIPVKVIADFKHDALKEVLPKGYKTVLEFEIRTEPQVLVHEYKRRDGSVSPAVIAEAGTSTGKYSFVGANGGTYDDHWIYLFVGYKPIDEIFKKTKG